MSVRVRAHQNRKGATLVRGATSASRLCHSGTCPRDAERRHGLLVAGDGYNDPELPRPSPDRRSEARSRCRAARQEVPECKRFPRNSPTCCARK